MYAFFPTNATEHNTLTQKSKQDLGKIPGAILLHPKNKPRKPLSSDIPANYVKEYNEAFDVLPISPNASAAISRRCLQRLLREKTNVKHGDLSNEIQQVLDSGDLPTHLADDIDAIRNVGNFAAHPNKSTQSGSIIDVETGEAEWNLEVLEGLLDFYFVQPAISQRRRDALNQKLTDARKPPMKK